MYTGVFYVALCVAMLFMSQPQSSIEPVGMSRGQRLLLKGPRGIRQIRGEHLSHMTSLLHSHMFTEQGIKLKWIKERISRYALLAGQMVILVWTRLLYSIEPSSACWSNPLTRSDPLTQFDHSVLIGQALQPSSTTPCCLP